jgi:hypothetical protein
MVNVNSELEIYHYKLNHKIKLKFNLFMVISRFAFDGLGYVL